jgi:hypothetical protein
MGLIAFLKGSGSTSIKQDSEQTEGGLVERMSAGPSASVSATRNSGAEASAPLEMETDGWRRHLREYTDFTRKDEDHEASVGALVELIKNNELQLLDLVSVCR